MATIAEMFEAGTISVEGVGNGQYLVERKRFDPDTGFELNTPARQTVTVGQLKESLAELERQYRDIKRVLREIESLEDTDEDTED